MAVKHEKRLYRVDTNVLQDTVLSSLYVIW